MATVYLGLGSNMGNKEGHLRNAVLAISSQIGMVTKISSLYETEAWGYESANDYLNATIAVETELYPEELLRSLKEIETSLGRKPKPNTTQPYEDRPIDIDILFYDDLACETAEIVIPHRHIAERSFVLGPMAEIAPDLVHPTLQKTMRELNKLLQ